MSWTVACLSWDRSEFGKNKGKPFTQSVRESKDKPKQATTVLLEQSLLYILLTLETHTNNWDW